MTIAPTIAMRPRSALACADLSFHWYLKVAARPMLRMQIGVGVLLVVVFVACMQTHDAWISGFVPPIVAWLTQGWFIPAAGQLLFERHPSVLARPRPSQLLVWTLQEAVILTLTTVLMLVLFLGVPFLAFLSLRGPIFFLEKQSYLARIRRMFSLATRRLGFVSVAWLCGLFARVWLESTLVAVAAMIDVYWGGGRLPSDDFASSVLLGACVTAAIWATAPWAACFQVLSYVHARIDDDSWDLQVESLTAAATLEAQRGHGA